MELSRKYNKWEIKINKMGRNLRQDFDCQVKTFELFSIKPTTKYLKISLKKEMGQFIIFFVALVEGKVFLKKYHHFEEHIPVRFELKKMQFALI